MQLFSQNLKTLRETWGISATEMAKKFSVAVTSYTRWETGTEPSLENVVALSKFFKVSIDDLLTKELTVEDVPPRYGAPPARAIAKVEEAAGDYDEEVSRLIKTILEKIADLDGRVGRLESQGH